MSKRSMLILPAVGALFFSGCVSSQKYAKLQSDMAACSAQADKCTANAAALQQQIDALNKDKAALAETEKAKEAEIGQLKGTYDQLVGNLKNEISAGEIQVTQLKDKLTLNLVEKILFDSGKAEVKESGMKVLDRIADVLKQVKDKDIRVEGHTDNVRVGPKLRARFPTNWELSTARATNVVRYLQEHDGMDPNRLVAAGYGEYHPVAPNDTPEGHAQNRRIDIVLVPHESTAMNPTPAAVNPAGSTSAPTTPPAGSEPAASPAVTTPTEQAPAPVVPAQ